MKTGLERISELATQDPKLVFTSIYHFINVNLLRQCHKEMDGKKAVGVDEMTKAEYEENLEANLEDLVNRLKRKGYRPQPSLRVYIPKANGKMRPLGISAYEDKLVQDALGRVLSAVFEPKFQDSMHGFRPGRDCHTALIALNKLIEDGKTNYVVDADIKGFFNNMEHEKILQAIRFRIADPNIIWLVKKFLNAGVMEDGKWHATTRGTEQGNLASPVIANIYMHYTLALWYDKKFKPTCEGESGLVIYADDFVATFQYKEEAERFLDAVKSRFQECGLELEMEKTRLVEFGRFAAERRASRGEGKPETFTFLGFTHYCSKSRDGRFRVKRRTSAKKMRLKLTALNDWLRKNRHLPVGNLIEKLNARLRGHYNYYGITDNIFSLKVYYRYAIYALFKWLNRRSQRPSYTWDGFRELLNVFPLEVPKIRVSIYRQYPQISK